MHRQKHLPWFFALQRARPLSELFLMASVLQHAFTTGRGLAHEKEAGT